MAVSGAVEELEQLLMTRRAAMPITTGSRSLLTTDEATTLRGNAQKSPTRPKFNELLRQTGQSGAPGRVPSDNHRSAAAAGAGPSNGNGSIPPIAKAGTSSTSTSAALAAVEMPSMTRNGSGPAPSAFAQICTNGADLAKAAANKNASALPNIRSTRPTNNSAVAIAPLLISGKAAAAPVASDRARSPPVPTVQSKDAAGANARKGSGMAAAGVGALRPTPTSAPSSARSSAPNSAPNSARGNDRPVAAGRQVIRRQSTAGDDPPDGMNPAGPRNPAAMSVATKPEAPPRTRLAPGVAIEQQARRAAAGAPPEPAAVRAPPGNAAMRNFLAQNPREAPTRLPPELQREIDRGIEEDLLQLAQRESRALAIHNGRPAPAPSTAENPPNCFYDEDDELLAQALQASMEDF